MNVIENLTTRTIQNKQLPINELLDNSFYYPSSGFDGGVIKYYGKEIQSFFYCDYATGGEALMSKLNNFLGYKLLGHRPIKQEELVPNGWKMQPPPNFNLQRYYKYRDVFKKPFAHWAVYERLDSFSEIHGPNRFSLVYIGGEGVATYQALYWSNKKTAKALAIIQPGHGFGLNWTDFTKRDGALAWVVMNNPFGSPKIILHGGIGSGYNDLDWEEYKLEKTINPYYNRSGEATVWIRK